MSLFRNIFIPVFVALAAALLFQHQLRDTATTAIELVKNYTTANNLFPFAEQTDNTNHPNQDQHPAYRLLATEMSSQRAIRKVILAIEQAEGAGARVRRSIGTPQLRNFSPFLMLDHFSIKPGAGFPDQ